MLRFVLSGLTVFVCGTTFIDGWHYNLPKRWLNTSLHRQVKLPILGKKTQKMHTFFNKWVFPSQRIQSFYVHLQKLNTPSSLPRSCYWTKQQSSYLFNSEQPNVPLFHLVWSELLYTTQDNFTIGIHQGISSRRTQQSHGDVPNRLWRSILSAGEQKAISDIFT